MSGHSKWATIKHKKGAADKARGKLFAKIARQIEVAAKAGGGDIDANPTLRTAVAKARAARMTNDAIDRAIKRGTGEAGAEREIPELQVGGLDYDAGPGVERAGSAYAERGNLTAFKPRALDRLTPGAGYRGEYFFVVAPGLCLCAGAAHYLPLAVYDCAAHLRPAQIQAKDI